MKKLILALACISAVTSAHASTIESMKCGSGTLNTELVQKEIGGIGSVTTEATMKGLITEANGATKSGDGVIENSSKMAIVISVSGKADSYCVSDAPTFISITVNK